MGRIAIKYRAISIAALRTALCGVAGRRPSCVEGSANGRKLAAEMVQLRR
jgi:hypothetical protein